MHSQDLIDELCKEYKRLGAGAWQRRRSWPQFGYNFQQTKSEHEFLKACFDEIEEPDQVQNNTDTENIPFVEALHCFAQQASKQILSRKSSFHKQFSKLVAQATYELVLRETSALLAPILYQEFKRRNLSHFSSLDFRMKKKKYGDVRYKSFVRHLRNGGLQALLTKNSASLIILPRLCESRVSSALRIIDLFEEDQKCLIEKFEISQGSEPTNFAYLNSDPHQGGQRVSSVEYSCGRKVVLKMRTSKLAEAARGLIDEISSSISGMRVYDFPRLVRCEHEWCQFVAHVGENGAQIAEYYFHLGVLSAISYFFGGTDLHSENIISHNGLPIVVDFEMFFVGRVHSSTKQEDDVKQKSSDTVLHTGIFPRWEIDNFGQAQDVSALGYVPQVGNDESTCLVWDKINTDYMCQTVSPLGPIEGSSLPSSLDEASLPNFFMAEILEGFAQVYDHISKNRAKYLAWVNSEEIQTAATRFVFRPTHVYYQMLSEMCKPGNLSSPETTLAKLDLLLHRCVLDYELCPPELTLINSEIQGIFDGDIPIFFLRADSRDVEIPQRPTLQGFIGETGVEAVTRRISGATFADKEFQLKLIELSIVARFGGAEKHLIAEPIFVHSKNTDMLSQKAGEIANHLFENAVLDQNRHITWFGMGLLGQGNRIQLDCIDNGLYTGRLGVALFLATYARIFGVRGYRDLASRCAFEYLDRSLAQSEANSVRARSIGLSGLGGEIYALSTIGELLDDPSISDAAVELFLNSASDLNLSPPAELMGGFAGFLLAGQRLVRWRENKSLSNACDRIEERLIEQASMDREGLRGWQTPEFRCTQTGLAHGVSGIILALCRSKNKSPDLVASILAGLAFERRHLSKNSNNWIDLREESNDTDDHMCSWCYGAPGIGYSRLGMLEFLDEQDFPQRLEIENVLIEDLTTALIGVSECLHNKPDHFCCGNAGRIGFLHSASMSPYVSLDSLRTDHFSRWDMTPNNIGNYVLHETVNGRTTEPSLFRGLSGIGMTLLSMVQPSQVPNFHTMT